MIRILCALLLSLSLSQAYCDTDTPNSFLNARQANTVGGVCSRAHDGDFALLRGHFIKMIDETTFLFTDDDEHQIVVHFDEGSLPPDFELGYDYYLWAQMHKEIFSRSYLQAVFLSPKKRLP